MNEQSQNPGKRAHLDDLGDKVIWEMGGDRPILETKNPEVRLTRRGALQKVIRAVLLAAGASFAVGVGVVSQAAHSDTHTDTAHSDTPHVDTQHIDTPHSDTAHSDGNDHTDGPHHDATNSSGQHIDSPFTDRDVHSDAPHNDSPHEDTAHYDEAHSDTPHSDTHADAP